MNDREHAPIDLEGLVRNTGANPSFLLNLFRIYVAQTEELLCGIEAAIRAEDYVRLRNDAHKLKGSSDGVQADRMGQLGKSLMDHGEQATGVVPELEAEFARVRAFVAEYEKKHR